MWLFFRHPNLYHWFYKLLFYTCIYTLLNDLVDLISAYTDTRTIVYRRTIMYNAVNIAKKRNLNRHTSLHVQLCNCRRRLINSAFHHPTATGLNFVIYGNAYLLIFATPNGGPIYPSRGLLYLLGYKRLEGAQSIHLGGCFICWAING